MGIEGDGNDAMAPHGGIDAKGKDSRRGASATARALRERGREMARAAAASGAARVDCARTTPPATSPGGDARGIERDSALMEMGKVVVADALVEKVVEGDALVMVTVDVAAAALASETEPLATVTAPTATLDSPNPFIAVGPLILPLPLLIAVGPPWAPWCVVLCMHQHPPPYRTLKSRHSEKGRASKRTRGITG